MSPYGQPFNIGIRTIPLDPYVPFKSRARPASIPPAFAVFFLQWKQRNLSLIGDLLHQGQGQECFQNLTLRVQMVI